MSQSKKPSKVAGAGAGIAKLVGGTAKPAPTGKSGSAAKPKEAAKPRGKEVGGYTMPAEELDLMALPPACPTTVTRRFEFDAAHRVLGHQGKCKHLHGHRYVVEITVSGPELDALGMVVDFGVLKEKVGGFITAVYDHNIILHKDDPLLALKGATSVKAVTRGKSDRQPTVNTVEPDDIFTREPVVLPYNPTAEKLAEVIYRQAEELLTEDSLAVVAVRVYETPNCWADYCPPEGGGGGQPGDKDGDETEGGGEEDGEDDNGGGDGDDEDDNGGGDGDDEEGEEDEGEGGVDGDDGDEDEEEDGPTVEGPAKTETPVTQPPKKVRRERI